MAFHSNTCSMTGATLSHPVVSSKSGHLFEKEAIEKHLSTFPYCPITNQPLEPSDLVEVVCVKEEGDNTNKASESLRSYMDRLQNEYDTLVLERHALGKAIGQTEQELLHCRFRNGAAERVVGTLLREKEETEREAAELAAKLDKLESN